MISDILKAKVLMSVARGSSVSGSARANGLTPRQGRDAISRLCRTFRLPSDISEIQANPQPYLLAASEIGNTPKYALRKELRVRLQRHLKLRSADELTPKYISNLTSEMILEAGITAGALADIQEWLTQNGISLTQKAPSSDVHMQLVKRAIFLLASFGFDVEASKTQLSGLVD